MEKIFFLLTLLLSFNVFAEGQIIDPIQTPNYTVNCTFPDQRTNNVGLPRNEIAFVQFFVSTDKKTWTPAGNNSAECKQVYDLSNVPDGQYYYTAKVFDIDDRQSVYSIDNPDNATTGETGYAAIMVQRPITDPKPATGLNGVASQ